MSVDLFKMYKMVLQRYRRNEWSRPHEEMLEIIETIIRSKKIDAEAALVLAERFAEIEKNLVGIQTFYHRNLILALKTGDYEISIPYQVQHRWNEKPSDCGFVYVAVRFDNTESIKIGASCDVEARLKAFGNKYRCRCKVFWKARVMQPFALEASVQETLRDFRVSGLTYMESNEWYAISPERAVATIENVIRNKGFNYAPF